VFETGIRQMRMAMSMVWGRPINPRNIERLIEDCLKTLAEFGTPGDDVQQVLDGPFTDPSARRQFQNRALQLTTRRLKKNSPYYQQLFAKHAINPDHVTIDNVHEIPVTRKQMLQEQETDFISTDTTPYITTRTTGTTGQPTEIWLSRYETELWPALSALSGLLRGDLSPHDCEQINLSSRATAAVQMNATTCRLLGARAHVLGIIPPEESLQHLLTGDDEAPTILITYPSYLAQLINLARERNLGPRDFHLRRIDCGGEVFSAALAQAAWETLGARPFDGFGMTECLPVTGRVCSQGHMHHDLNIGFVEVIDLDTGEPASPGALGTVVITPYYPYRECMPIFRYDTRDVVRALPDEPLNCELAGTPATTRILGKADHLLRVKDQIVTSRDLVEVYEALPSHPWPARFRVEVVKDHIEMVVSQEALNGVTMAEIERRYHQIGIPVTITNSVDQEDAIRSLRPLRADLRETTFAGWRN
jgi:phenylacetate-CoA ligase